MSKFKSLKLCDAKDKQTKISSFFLKPNKSEKNAILTNSSTDVKKSNLPACQLVDVKDLGKSLDKSSELVVVENRKIEKCQNKSPLKETLNVAKFEENKNCGNTQNNCISPKQQNLSSHCLEQNKDKIGNSNNSPDFVPPTPTMIDNKKTRKKGLKRKFSFSKSDDMEKECLNSNVKNQNFPVENNCTIHSELPDMFCNQKIESNEIPIICNTERIQKENVNFSRALKEVEDDLLKTNNCNTLAVDRKRSRLPIESNLHGKEPIENTSLKPKVLSDITTASFLKSPVNKNTCTTKEYIEKSCDDNNYLFLEDLELDDIKENNLISLASSVKCQVITLQPKHGELVLSLKTSQDNAFVTCVLRDSWATCKLSVGDFVIVSAKPIDEQPGCWKVDNEVGSVVLHPDALVSGTTLLGSLFCKRKSVLSDGYRGLDCDSKVMTIGSLLHMLFQEVLKRNVTTFEGIKQIVEHIMSSKHLLFTLYSSKMTLEEARTELQAFIPQIHNFIQQYISPDEIFCAQSQKTYGNNVWKGRITGIADIEENIWSPKLGLKGKVDVTIHARVNSKKKIMPLELKTGRASFSAEHQGQVILYTMMMTELGHNVDSGLLLYLREGAMKEIMFGPAEHRDLILLRNQFVYYLESSKVVTYNEKECTIEVPDLPEPINHHSACSKCPYLTLCSAALKQKGLEQLSQSNQLKTLSITSTEHLKEQHIQYVFHWSGLLRLEQAEIQKNGIKIQDIWLQTPQQREENGNCISNVTLVGDVKEIIDGYYEHTFSWSGAINCSVSEGEYLVVSSCSRAAVAAGTVRSVSDNIITLRLERDLSVRGESTWHLDRYESQTLLTFNLTNLACLLDNTEEAKFVRKAIISLDIPKFAPKLSSKVLKVGADLLSSLNSGQKSAVLRSLAAQQYVLIKGMPGTGKTATLVSLVLLAVRLGQTVLITSHTHSAVDNVLIRLKGKVEYLRLGSSHRLHPDLIQYGEDNNSCTTPDQLEAFYNSKPVVGVTCFGSGHPLLRRRKFDLCLVDEATQVLQPTVLRPLISAKKFILVGDPDQLSPLVRSQEAKKYGLGVSLFERLDRPAVTTVLTLQYRMNDTITKLANHLTYNGELSCGNESIQHATIKLKLSVESQPSWIRSALSSQLENAVVVLDTGDVTSTNSNCNNQFEADIVVQLLHVLKKGGISESDVGVMSPYRAQVSLLKQQISNTSVEVNTVDQYQGRDKDIIIYSCTRSSVAKEFDILSDQKRMTVAITRARHKLIFIGNIQILKGYTVFQKLFTFISDSNFISLKAATSHLVSDI